MIYYKVSQSKWNDVLVHPSWDVIAQPNNPWWFFFEPSTGNRVCVCHHYTGLDDKYGIAHFIGGSQAVFDDFKAWVDDVATEANIIADDTGWEELTAFTPFYPDTATVDGHTVNLTKPWDADGRPAWACRQKLAGVV